jgi:type I restriction enzyme R subunit
VVKITGASEQPQNLIRRFKNEAFPNVAVTVELLSTGVDVPAIGNIVFLRRMNSRILYDQMIGRATRLCEPIGKSHFRIFDAVGTYNTLQPFSQLLGELSASDDPDDAQLIRQQLVAKLRRKRGRLRLNQVERLLRLTGEEPEAFINRLQGLPIEEASRWVAGIEGLGELLDEPWEGPFTALMISEHEDALHSIVHGYGDGKRPEDYLEGLRIYGN